MLFEILWNEFCCAYICIYKYTFMYVFELGFGIVNWCTCNVKVLNLSIIFGLVAEKVGNELTSFNMITLRMKKTHWAA